MNILVIISEAPPIMSGISRVCEEVHRRLRIMGHTVTTISSNDIPRLELGEVRLSSMAWKGFQRTLPQMNAYDVVHIHGPVPTFSDVALGLGALNRLWGGPPVVYTHHCEIELPGKEGWCAPYNVTHRVLARLADHVVVSTPSYARSFADFIPTKRISVIPWGVNMRRPVAPKPDGLNILYVGQLRPYKGLDVLLHAMRHVADATLTVIGSGHRAEFYHDLAAKLHLRNVRFVGKADDDTMQRAYADAHALVLPSLTRAEAFGLVLLEGMAAGCVPIASHLPGLTDVIGQVGYTFPAHSDHVLGALLREIGATRGATERLAAAARQWATQFSWDTVTRAYEQLYQSLIQRRTDLASNWFPPPLAAVRPARSVMRSGQQALKGTAEALLHDIAEQFGATRASLLLQHDTDDVFVISAQQGLNTNLIGVCVPQHGSLAGWVAARRQPVCITSDSAPAEVRPYLRTPDLTSALSIPVYDEEEQNVIGVLSVARHAREEAYTHDDLRKLITSVAARTSMRPTGELAAYASATA